MTIPIHPFRRSPPRERLGAGGGLPGLDFLRISGLEPRLCFRSAGLAEMGGLFSQLALKKDENNTLLFLETKKQYI
jgi:hypothetical protein